MAAMYADKAGKRQLINPDEACSKQAAGCFAPGTVKIAACLFTGLAGGHGFIACFQSA